MMCGIGKTTLLPRGRFGKGEARVLAGPDGLGCWPLRTDITAVTLVIAIAIIIIVVVVGVTRRHKLGM